MEEVKEQSKPTMKIVKAGDVALDAKKSQNKVDKKLVNKLTKEFDTLQAQLSTKQYGIELNKELTDSLFEQFYPTFEWKGYESYAISETNKQLREGINKKGELNSKFAVEVVEATFHFLKTYQGKGVESANVFRSICDQFAICINEINQDRQSLKDLSMELVAAEMGISVEDLAKTQMQEN